MKKLFCDCKTDAEKSAFFLSGRAVETGVIAAAISNDVAMAYHRCDEFKKEVDAMRARVAEMERQELGFRERCTPAAPAGGSNRFPLYALPGSKGEEK